MRPVRRDLSLADWQLGLVSTALLWIYGIFSPLGGYPADRYSRRAAILVSLAVWSVVAALNDAARNYAELIAVRALMGLSEAFYLPAALGVLLVCCALLVVRLGRKERWGHDTR